MRLLVGLGEDVHGAVCDEGTGKAEARIGKDHGRGVGVHEFRTYGLTIVVELSAVVIGDVEDHGVRDGRFLHLVAQRIAHGDFGWAVIPGRLVVADDLQWEGLALQEGGEEGILVGTARIGRVVKEQGHIRGDLARNGRGVELADLLIEVQVGRQLAEEFLRDDLNVDAGVGCADLVTGRGSGGEPTLLVDAEAGGLEEGHRRKALDEGAGAVEVEGVGGPIAEGDFGIVLGLVQIPQRGIQGYGTPRAGQPPASGPAIEPEVDRVGADVTDGTFLHRLVAEGGHGGGGVPDTVGGHRDRVGAGSGIGVGRWEFEVRAGDRRGSVAEVPGVVHVGGRCESTHGFKVHVKAIGQALHGVGQGAEGRTQITASQRIQGDHRCLHVGGVQKEGGGGGVRNGEGSRIVRYDDGGNRYGLAGTIGAGCIRGDDVQVELVRGGHALPIAGQQKVDVGVVPRFDLEHFRVVDEGLVAVVRERGIGPVVHGFTRVLGRHTEHLQIPVSGAEIAHRSGHAEGNIAVMRAHGIGPEVLVQVASEHEAVSRAVRLEVEGFDDLRIADRRIDVDRVHDLWHTVRRIDGADRVLLVLEVVEGEEERLVRQGEDVRSHDPDIRGGTGRFPIGTAPVKTAVVVHTGDQCTLPRVAVVRVLVDGPDDQHACAIVDHLAQEIVVHTAVRGVEFHGPLEAEPGWTHERANVESLVVATGGGHVAGPPRARDVHLLLEHVEIEPEQPRVVWIRLVRSFKDVLVDQRTGRGVEEEHEPAVAEGARVGQPDMAHRCDDAAVVARHHLHVGDPDEEGGIEPVLPDDVPILLLAHDDAATLRGRRGR